MQEIKLTVAGDNAPIPLTVESGKIIHDGGLPDGGTTGQVLTKVSDQDGDADWQTPSGGAVQDVQVNGVSVLDAQGVANVPIATDDVFGAVRTGGDMGLGMYGGRIFIGVASDAKFKSGNGWYNAVTISKQHISTFYGLAKAAGSDEKNSTLSIGQYTDAAKSAISQMLNGSVTVSGTTPSITALSGIQYVCGEVATLDIMLPASGCVDVVFESGSTPTVLTITPPNGVALKWANGFDPTSLDANTTYEINIKDGLGVACGWT